MPRFDIERNWLDRLVSFMSPVRGAKRDAARMRTLAYENLGRTMALDRWRDSSVGRMDTIWPTEDFVAMSTRGFRDQGIVNLRDRARNLVRNNYLAKSLLHTSGSFVIGRGTKITPASGDERFDDEARDFWKQWWTDGRPDVGSDKAGPLLERRMYRAWKRDGDIGAILLRSGKVQIVEGDQINTPGRLISDRSVVEGVRVNAQGRPQTFYVETDSGDPNKTVHNGIPARDFAWCATEERFRSVRGISVFNGTFGLFDQLDGYIDGLVTAARIATLFGLLIREGPTSYWDNLKDLTGADAPKDASWKEIELTPGLIRKIASTDSVEQIKPEQPHTAADKLITMLVRFSSLCLHLPLEVALMDFKGTTYSSTKAALTISDRSLDEAYDEFFRCTLGRFYPWRISKAIKDGEIRPPADGAKVFNVKRKRDPLKYIDPVKDVESHKEGVSANFELLEDVLALNDLTLDEYVARRKVEIEKLKEAGIPMPSPESVEVEDDPDEGVETDE